MKCLKTEALLWLTEINISETLEVMKWRKKIVASRTFEKFCGLGKRIEIL
jgi:hypothetical protein